MTAKQLLRQLADKGIQFVLHRNSVSLQLTKPTAYTRSRTPQRVTPEEQSELLRHKDEVFDRVLRGRWAEEVDPNGHTLTGRKYEKGKWMSE